jgi:hypothetical protein
MVYEHISRCFIPQEPSLGFSELFKDVFVVACSDIPMLVALVLGVNRLLAMAKDSIGFRPIVVGEVFIQLISRSIIL